MILDACPRYCGVSGFAKTFVRVEEKVSVATCSMRAFQVAIAESGAETSDADESVALEIRLVVTVERAASTRS